MLDHLGRGHVTRSEPTPRASGSVFFSHPLSPPARALAAERFLRDAHFSLPDFDSRPRPPAPPSLSPLMEPPLSLCSESKLGVQSVHPICTKPFDFEHCWGGGGEEVVSSASRAGRAPCEGAGDPGARHCRFPRLESVRQSRGRVGLPWARWRGFQILTRASPSWSL